MLTFALLKTNTALIMRNLLVTLFTLISVLSYAQKGKISGVVKDKDMDLEPLAFVNVYVQGNTSIGTTTDFDGNYVLSLNPGKHTIVFDFVGYKPVKKAIDVVAGKTQNIQVIMETLADALEAVIISVKTNKESEKALIAEQKEAVVIVESIGAEQLSKAGVSDAAAATAKIAGVQKNESSGDVYIRGLGDRYLFTTMNGLPIPSDNIEKKNIDLNLFPTSIIQNVGISKTYDTSSYADQTSGHVNIISKEYTSSVKGVKVGLGTGVNSNVVGVFGNFKASQNNNDIVFGYYNSNLTPGTALLEQSWNTETQNIPLDYSFSITGGNKFAVNDKQDLSIVLSLSNSKSYSYQYGTFSQYRANSRNNAFNDVEEFGTSMNTTALIDLKYQFGKNHDIKLSNLYINKLSDNVYEQGRDGFGFVFDQQPAEYGAFIRDQNTKQTTILVNQLLGNHHINEKNKLNWAFGINSVQANEPNRIRNEVNFGTQENNRLEPFNTVDPGFVRYAYVGGFQQRKSNQEIKDFEYNAKLNYQLTVIDEEAQRVRFNLGANYRNRLRDFKSKFDGFIVTNIGNKNSFSVNSIDDLSQGFKQENLDNGYLKYQNQLPDTYKANLNIGAAYLNTDMKFGSLTLGVGVRFEQDIIDLKEWDVNNYPGRVGSSKKEYQNFLPSFTIKKELNEQHTLRFAGSKTITLPEFKELAPFNYASQTGRITSGNPELIASTNYNLDVKWEFFPVKQGLVSATVFYKMIQDPINRSLSTGSSGYFTYSNTGERANVLGLEIENKIGLYESDTFGKLDLKSNATYMYHNQDLKREFQFSNVTQSGLAGASDYIINAGLNYSNNKENELNAALSANYSSDKIFSLGAPESFTNSKTIFNDEIIEKGFLTLDFVVSKQLTDKLKIKGSVKNMLNPSIEQTQDVTTRKGVSTKIVSSYKRGIDAGLSLNYSF